MWQNITQVGCAWKITIKPQFCSGCDYPIGTNDPNGMCLGRCNNPPRVLNLISGCGDPTCPTAAQISSGNLTSC